jgi:two-component system nitrate/nitrite response regulator NarL
MPVIALVDNQRLFTSAVAIPLRGRGFDVVEPAVAPASELETTLDKAAPAVVALDLDLGCAGPGDALVGPLTERGAAVLVVSAISDDARIGSCLVRGAVGWVPKTADVDELVGAVEAAAEGRAVLCASERSRLVEAWRRSQPERALPSGLDKLSPREAFVLGELVGGRSVAEIARDSWVAETTVRSQVRSILAKLNVRSQLQAVALASREGWTAA